MGEEQKNSAMSVLDEIRSTIASIDALRGKESSSATVPPSTQKVAEPSVASTAVAVAEPKAPTADQPVPSSISSVEPSFPLDSIPFEKMKEAVDAAMGKTTESKRRPAVEKKTESPGGNVSSPEIPQSSAVPQQPQQPQRPSASRPALDDEDSTSNFVAPSTLMTMRSANRDAKIMIVDDEPLNVMTFRQHLKTEGYSNFVTTEDPRKALVMLRDERPDVLLLDIHMPEITGLDIMRVVGLDPQLQHIPVLILTADTDPLTRRKCLDLGASDFLSKPIDPNELLPRVRNAITLKTHFDMVMNEAARLEQQVERRTRQLEATRQQLIISLARAAEHRDNDTGNHVIRVGRYTSIIAEGLGYPKSKLQMLEQAAQLHDVGKIGIPDSILFKPGRLDPDEYDLMKRHCSLGKQIIEPISDKDWEMLQTHTRRGENLLHVRSSPLLMLAARIAQTHHEKWDGSGYPLGLAGDDIPIEGRMVAVADVFDALSSERPYKEPFSREKCFEILEEGRGKHFDPKVLDAFFGASDRIVDTQLSLMDDEEHIKTAQYS